MQFIETLCCLTVSLCFIKPQKCFNLYPYAAETEIANKKSFQIKLLSGDTNVDDLGDIIFKIIKLFHIKFLVNGALYGKSDYTVLIRNHTLAFDWCHF